MIISQVPFGLLRDNYQRARILMNFSLILKYESRDLYPLSKSSSFIGSVQISYLIKSQSFWKRIVPYCVKTLLWKRVFTQYPTRIIEADDHFNVTYTVLQINNILWLLSWKNDQGLYYSGQNISERCEGSFFENTEYITKSNVLHHEGFKLNLL